MSGATLAACQRNAIGPARVGLSVHIVCEVANALHAAHGRTDPATGRAFVHGCVSPDTVRLRYDGAIELLAATDAARAEALRSSPGHLAPEQVTGSDVDRRADVFSLGVVLWELLTATRLFERESASATRIAVVDDPILDVRDVNPDVPEVVAQVLGAALERKRESRFDSIEALSRALAGAAASSGVARASREEVARWVAERVPPIRSSPSHPSDVPDLDLPGSSRAHRSRPHMEAVRAPASPPSASAPAIPDFDVNAMAAAALAPSTRPPAMSAPPIAGAPASGRPSSPSSPSASGRTSSAGGGGGREIAFEPGDDDDFDMQIERNLASTSIPVAPRARTSGVPARTSGGHRVAGTGLELAQPSRMARDKASRAEQEDDEPGLFMKLAAALVTLAIAAGTVFALMHEIHRAGGRDLTRLLPHAFDGTSGTESGAVALVALVVAVAVGFVGLKLRPHAWAIIASGGVLLLLALAMVTVTLASTGENTAPPDGVLLVPYLFPAAAALFALGLYARSSRRFARARGAGRAGALPLAALAGALAFVAFETSRLSR